MRKLQLSIRSESQFIQRIPCQPEIFSFLLHTARTLPLPQKLSRAQHAETPAHFIRRLKIAAAGHRKSAIFCTADIFISNYQQSSIKKQLTAVLPFVLP